MSLHVERFGHGPDVVLLHGWAMHGGVFAALIERLRERCTLHVVDLPGHGSSRDSDVPLQLGACVQAVRGVVPENAAWCGWSLGGLIALRAALDGHSRGLAMLCATPCFVRSEQWCYAVSGEIFEDFATGLRSDWRGTLDRFLALEAFGSDHVKDELRALRATLFARGEPAASVLAQGLDVLQHTDLRGELAQLRVPSTWIAGRRDRLVDPRAMQWSAQQLEAASYHCIEHAGHAPFLTHADEVVEALSPWLDEVH